jgi:hypothetical protein
MKGLDKGPKIELSKLKPGNLKVPGVLQDLWNDLRSQRLLPVVAILIVGLIAIPVLLGGSTKPKPEASIAAPAPAESGSQDLTVAKFAPGLRDYRLRYKHRQAVSPFRAPGATNGAEGAGEGGGSTSPELTETAEPGGGSEAVPSEGSEPPFEESPSTEPGEGEHGPTAKEEEEKAIEESTIDVRVTALHLDGTSSESVRRNVKKMEPLPSQAVPALLYAGPTADGKAATMAVSSDVTDLAGNANCVDKGEPCKLLELKLGQPETVVFGTTGLTYRVELVRIGAHILGSNSSGESSKGNGRSNQEKVPPTAEEEGKGGFKLEHLIHLSRRSVAAG